MDDVSLLVNGKRWKWWKGIRVTNSAEALAGSFVLDVSQSRASVPIKEEDACRVLIDDEVVIDGFVDRRNASFSGRNKSLSFSGRDAPAVLVDCSVLLEKWTFRNVNAFDIAKKVAGQFGIPVSMQEGVTLTKVGKLVVNYGDTAFSVIDRAAKAAGVVVVSDRSGGIVLTRADDETRSDALVEGENLLSGSSDYDSSDRFSRYVVATQVPGSDNAFGSATRIRAEAIDDVVRRTNRVLVVRPHVGMTKKIAKQRGEWEARTRAARAESVEVTVRGYRQRSGKLWRTNSLSRLRAPRLLGVDREMRISQVTYLANDEAGKKTKLRLVRPDAFLAVSAA